MISSLNYLKDPGSCEAFKNSGQKVEVAERIPCAFKKKHGGLDFIEVGVPKLVLSARGMEGWFMSLAMPWAKTRPVRVLTLGETGVASLPETNSSSLMGMDTVSRFIVSSLRFKRWLELLVFYRVVSMILP